MRATLDSRQARSSNVLRSSSTNILASQIGRRQFITILLVVIIPIALLSVSLYFTQRSNIIDEKLQELNAVANVEESIIDVSLENLETILTLTANSRDLVIGVDVLSRLPENESSLVIIERTLNDITGENQLFETTGVFDLEGNLLASAAAEEGEADLPTAEEVVNLPEYIAGQYNPTIGFPSYDEEEQRSDVILTTPIYDTSGSLIGVILGVAHLDSLSVLLRENIVGTIESEDVYLVSSSGRLLTSTLSLELGESVSSSGIDSALGGESNTERYNNYRDVNVIGAYRWLPQYEMALIIEAETDVIVPAPTDLVVSILPTIALSLVLAIVLVIITVNGFVRPVIQIASSARRFSYGELDARVPPDTGYGELKILGTTFNEMADQVQAMVGGLEGQIATSTRDLQTVVDVSTRIATILNVEQLLEDVTDLTKERFSLYHTHIYLYDQEEDRFILTAGAGYVGEQMVAEKRSIDFHNVKSIVARAGRDRQSVRVGDVTDSPDFLPHPLLPDTRSELAIPLIARGELLGVLDVQSDKILYFETDIQSTLEVLATQISTALSNAQLFANAERTSRHEQALGEITRSIEGASSVDDVLQTAVRELGKALRVPHTAIELQLAPFSDELGDENN